MNETISAPSNGLKDLYTQNELYVSSIISVFGGELVSGANKQIHGLKALDNTTATTHDIGFLHQKSYIKQLKESSIGILITDQNIWEKIQTENIISSKQEEVQKKSQELTVIITENPYLYYAKIASIFEKSRLLDGLSNNHAVVCNEHVDASIAHSAIIPLSTYIGANAVIGENVIIGENCIIEAGCVIQENVTLGHGCHLYPRVTIYHGCQIGNDVIIHSGAVIGSDGFGFAPDFKPDNGNAFAWQKIPQLGIVVIGNNVEIGANTTIDRGALNNTIIGNHVKLDNQIQIAHNVEIGDFTVIAACTGIAGSTKIGKFCQIGGSCNIMGHIEIVDGCIISATTFISKSLTKKGQYTGAFPFSEHHEWEKNVVFIKYLHRLKKLFLMKSE